MRSYSGDLLNGRPLIVSGSEVLNGVFLADAAIVVDFADNPEQYEKLYLRTVEQLDDDSLEGVAHTVNRVIQEAMPPSEAKTGEVLKTAATARNLHRLRMCDEIGLSKFIESGGGVCYHQALAVASVVQLLGIRRDIAGKALIQTESLKPMVHTWVRYVNGRDEVIIDPHLNHVSSLKPKKFGRIRYNNF